MVGESAVGRPGPVEGPDVRRRHVRPYRLLVGLAAALFVVGLLQTAWLSDDAMITLRVVDNLLDGYGLRWNVAERVQVSTHPLWLLLVAAVVAITGEFYLPVLAFGAVLSVLAALVLARGVTRRGRPAAPLLVLAALALSKSYVDFSTSGLENPLTHLLAAGFLWAWFGAGQDDEGARRRRLSLLSLLAGLCFLSRPDSCLLFAPALLVAARGLPWRHRLPAWALAVVPGLLWMGFATFYFGEPFPVVAQAKLDAGTIPRSTLLVEAWLSFVYLAEHDRVMLVVLAAALVLGPRRHPALLAGIVAYLGYFVWIGGDFMGGRLLTAPLVLALAIVAYELGDRGRRELGAVVVLAIAAIGTTPGFVSGPDYHAPLEPVADERGYAYQRFGLFGSERARILPGSASRVFEEPDDERPVVLGVLAAGGVGLVAGPDFHLVDPWILDPLITRLPPYFIERTRPGHRTRRIPEGYWETLATGENRLRHPGLARLWDDLVLLHRGKLWSRERLGAIVRSLVGARAEDLRRYVEEDYFDPPRLAVAAADLAGHGGVGTPWWEAPMHVVYRGGLDIVLDEVVDPGGAALVALVDAGDRYRVELRREDDVVATGRAVSRRPAATGAGWVVVELEEAPAPDVALAFDRVRFEPVHASDGIFAVGGLGRVEPARRRP